MGLFKEKANQEAQKMALRSHPSRKNQCDT